MNQLINLLLYTSIVTTVIMLITSYFAIKQINKCKKYKIPILVTDLRIGNLVLNSKNKIIELKAISSQKLQEFYGIPLTDKLLIEHGFKNTSHDNYYIQVSEFAYLDIDLREKFVSLRENVRLADHDLEILVEHFHQVQNIYYTITNKELKKLK